MPSFSLQSIYFGAAVIGSALLVIQVALALLGGDADADVDVDADFDVEGIGVSFRTVVAFIAFFGVAGMAATKAGLGTALTLLVAVLSGSLAFWLVGLAMLQLSRLRSSGTVDIHNAVGVEGKIYLTVPKKRSGSGKVTIPIQGRTLQFRAITSGPELKTGELCRVVSVQGGDTLEVEGA